MLSAPSVARAIRPACVRRRSGIAGRAAPGFTELALEGRRRPEVAEEVASWHEAHLRLAELGLRAAGVANPQADAPLVVATITGFMLGQLVSPVDDFEERIFRPGLERLFAKLVESDAVPA